MINIPYGYNLSKFKMLNIAVRKTRLSKDNTIQKSVSTIATEMIPAIKYITGNGDSHSSIKHQFHSPIRMLETTKWHR